MWKVSFTLRECKSNPERVEVRKPVKLQSSWRNGRGADSFDDVLENAEALT